MYLKEIKAQGFKSFADHVNIELNNGITGIVGPNGSGKSNVVDAIRWVLGEQSIKSLRGDDNMTDVIFSGSKSRNRLNVASVTLVFDNSDHYLPVDYSEVAIKRRLYADSTNEYFINGEKCRLKDISNLLIDSGVAKESFNIISQGKIEEIISNKPSERRIIFEEAAGVLKYKKRKEEALRKLDRTHLNMQRISDIISELEVQVEPLKKQRDVAINYLNYKQELEQVEIALITSDISLINNKYQTSKNKIDALNEEILNINVSNSKNETKVEQYKEEIASLDKTVDKLQHDLLKLTTQVEQINAQKQIILERKKYEVEDAKYHNNLVVLTEEELKLGNDISSLETDINNKQNDLNSTLNIIQKEEAQITILKQNRFKVTEQLSLLFKEEATLKNKIQTLEYAIESNAALPYAVKQVINNPKLRGIHGAIANLVEIDEAYTIAISIALGSSSSYVVVDDEKVAKEAVNHLKNNNLGRATFYPLNVIKPRFIDEATKNLIKSQDGFIDIAANLIKCDSIYKDIIASQLGHVIVVKDIDTANNISKMINNRYKIVTLDGSLINVGGSITGGSVNKTHNVISDKYELENSLNALKRVSVDIQNCENKINEIDYQIKADEDRIYLLNKQKASEEELYLSKHNQIESLHEKLEAVKREVSGINNILDKKLSEEEEQVLTKYYETLSEKDKVKNELDLLVKKRNEVNAELEEYNFSLKKDNSLYHELSNQLKTLEIDVNRMDVKLDNLLNNLNETYSMTYEYALNNYHLDIEENVARSKVNQLKRAMKELGEVNLGAKDEYERISTRYEFLLKQQEDLKSAEDTLLDIIKEMDEVMSKDFIATFNIISENFKETFKDLFKGGYAELKLTDSSNVLETGIEIIASPPGKKLTSISLLSGGEKTFTAISLLFAILKSRPVPFCVLDEAEAALDEPNVDSFGSYLSKLKVQTQFILITHKKRTMEYVDTLYGITMQESGVSKLVSVKLEEVK